MSKPELKVGALAWVIKSHHPENLGLIVKVLDLFEGSKGMLMTMPTGRSCQITSSGLWATVETCGRLIKGHRVNRQTGKRTRTDFVQVKPFKTNRLKPFGDLDDDLDTTTGENLVLDLFTKTPEGVTS